jgi:hypothetical protein
MKYTSGKTSTWLALRNPVYSKLCFAMVISGSWMAAQNTAIYPKASPQVGCLRPETAQYPSPQNSSLIPPAETNAST